MGNKKQQVDYNGFPGGLCSIHSGEVCLPTQLQRAENVVIEKNGVVRKRPAAIQIDSNYYADFIIDLFNGYVSCHDKKIYTAGSLAHTYTNGGLGQFAYMDGYLHTNGKDAMVQIVGLTATACLGAPLSRIMLKHNDRCFVANGANLYETAVDTYPSSSVDNFADGASWLIGDTGQNITGLGAIGRNLIIFKQREIYIQVGYTKSERQTYQLTDQYGCLSPDSVKSANLGGLGECVIALSDNARLIAVTLSGVVEIGDCVQDILDTIYLGSPVNEKQLSTIMHRARATIHPEGFYILSFATTASDTHDAFDQALCLSTEYPYDSQFGRRWPITLWKKTGATGTSGQTFGAFGYSDISTIYGFKVHVPMTTSGGYTWGELAYEALNTIGTDSSGYRDRWGVSIPATYKWIDFYIQTKNEDIGLKRILKQWTDVFVRAIQEYPTAGSAFFPFKITQEVDFNLTVNSPPEIYQETFGQSASNKPTKYLVEMWHELVSDGFQTNITIENFDTIADADVRIHGISILWLRSNAD